MNGYCYGVDRLSEFAVDVKQRALIASADAASRTALKARVHNSSGGEGEQHTNDSPTFTISRVAFEYGQI